MFNNIGKAITYYRKALRITRAEVARKLEVSESTIENYEKGTTLPSMDKVVRLSHFFCISTDELLSFTPISK